MNKKILLFVIAGGVVVLGAVGWYVSSREPSPLEALRRMQAALADVRSYHQEAAYEVLADLSDLQTKTDSDILSVLASGSKEVKATFLSVGDVVLRDSGLPRAFQTTLDVKLSGGSMFVGGSGVTANTEVRMIDDVSYVKVNSFSFPLPILDFSKIYGTWYAFDAEKLARDFDVKKEAITGTDENEEVFDEKIVRIRELAQNTVWYTNPERLNLEQIGGVQTRHYRAELDKVALRSFMIEALVIFEAPLVTRSEAETTIDEIIANLDRVTVDLWIGRRDYLPYRITLVAPFTVPGPDVDGEGSEPPPELPITFTVTSNMSRYNEPVDIAVPENAKAVEELMGDVLGGLGGLPTSTGRENRGVGLMPVANGGGLPGGAPETMVGGADTDNDGLSDVQESFWGTNSQKPDTDGDGYSDGEEVKTGNNPLGSGPLF